MENNIRQVVALADEGNPRRGVRVSIRICPAICRQETSISLLPCLLSACDPDPRMGGTVILIDIDQNTREPFDHNGIFDRTCIPTVNPAASTSLNIS